MVYQPLSDTVGCPVPDVDNNYLCEMIDTVFTFVHFPRMFLSTDILFEQKIGQSTMGPLYIRCIY